jgi:hypothetical protein
MIPTDQQLRDLLETYRHCRKFAHAGEVGANAVVLIAALDELLALRANDIPPRVAGAAESQGRSEDEDPRVASTRWASAVFNKRWPNGTDG